MKLGLHIAQKTVILYLILGAIWILASDRALLLFTDDVEVINQLQTYKGWFFVLVTAVILFFYIRRQSIKIQKYNNELAISEKKYKALYTNAPLAYQSLNAQGHIVDVNPTWCNILGYERDQIIGKYFGDLLHEDFKAHFEENFEKFKIRGEVSDVRFRIKKSNGKYILVSFEGSIGYYTENTNLQTFCTFKDITEEHDIKQQLIERESRYRAMFYENISVMMIVDLAGNVLEANQSAQNYYGYKANEFLKLQFDDLLTGEPGTEHVLDNMLKSHQSTFEQVHQLKDGSTRNTLVYSSHINYKGQKVFYLIIHDITPMKEAESQLILAKDQAEESTKLVKAFLNNISHEIRTPMNSILGFSQMLVKPGTKDQKKQQYVEHIKQGCDVLLDKITDTVDISRVQTSSLKPLCDNIDLPGLINRIAKPYLHKTVENNEFTITTDLTGKQAYVYTDRYKLERIIKHLIDNAFKYAGKSEIKVHSRRREEKFEISISDHGPGIDRKMQDKIFHPFVKDLPDSTKPAGGTGVGLSIVKAFTEIIQGDLHLSSTPGSGTTFTLLIPERLKGD